MFASVKALFFALFLFALFCCERIRAVCARVDCWARGGVVRYVPRGARLARVLFDVDGDALCACDIMTANGSVLKTLCRGTTHVDVDDDTRNMKDFQARVMAVEPHGVDIPDTAMAVARQFLFQRCGGYASTRATVSEVIRIAEAAAGLREGAFNDRLTMVTVDFEELVLTCSDLVDKRS